MRKITRDAVEAFKIMKTSKEEIPKLRFIGRQIQ